MKKNPLSDAMGEISDQHIDEALSIDSKEAMERAKQKAARRRSSLVRRIALPVAACLCIVLAGVLIARPWAPAPGDPVLIDPQPGTAPPGTALEKDPAEDTAPAESQSGGAQTVPVPGTEPTAEPPAESEEVQIPNPMQDMETPESVGERLGHAIPELPGKTAAECTVIQYGPVPAMGRITYTDGTELAIGSEGEDISGIYGGETVKELAIGDVTVSIQTYEDQNYAVWSQDGFGWCWYAAPGDGDLAALEAFLGELVAAIQG